MRAIFVLFLALFCATSLGGCATLKRYYANIYEGLKTREAAVHPDVEHDSTKKPMSYEEYEAERQKLLKEEEK